MIIIPAILDSYRSMKDKSIKLTFETNELNPQDLLGIVENLNSFGYLAFKKEPFSESEKGQLESLKSEFNDNQKSDSTRLRNVFYRLYEKDSEGFKSFTTYYQHHMELLINHFKGKL